MGDSTEGVSAAGESARAACLERVRSEMRKIGDVCVGRIGRAMPGQLKILEVPGSEADCV